VRYCLLAIAVLGCGETGLARVTFPLHAAGSGERSFEQDGWTITLERADVGFGPMYLCATATADTNLCPQAEAEWLGAANVDALDPQAVMLGEADALTTTVRSAMFDYGRSWLLGADRARASDEAPDGHSAVLVAHADDGTRVIELRAEIDADPGFPGQSAVIGAPAGPHEITGDEALTVRFDPTAWWRRVDFERAAALDEDGDGEVELSPGDPDYEELVIGMTAGPLPALQWNSP
jgi:hypothetical protein